MPRNYLTVSDLVDFLANEVDQTLPVICDRYSDYHTVEQPTVIEAVLTPEGRWIRYYPEQWPKKGPKPNVRKVLHFKGN